MQKGVYFPQNQRMTRGARDQRGCDTALRPRGRAAHGPREAQVACTRGRRPHESTRTPVRGAMWRVERLAVGGPTGWWALVIGLGR